MKKPLSLILFSSALAFASGTVTPGARPGGARCATSSVEGVVAKLDVEGKRFAVSGPKSENREFKVAGDTLFRIPGATKEELKETPLSKMKENERVKVFYCSKDGSPVEVKVER